MRKLVKKAIDNGSLDKIVQGHRVVYSEPTPSGSVKSRTNEPDNNETCKFYTAGSSSVETNDVPEYGHLPPPPQLIEPTMKCAKCGHDVVSAGSALDESVEHLLFEQSRSPKGIQALKKQGNSGLLLEKLKKHGVGLFCRKCLAAWCPFCLNSIAPSTCGICSSDMVIYRKK